MHCLSSLLLLAFAYLNAHGCHGFSVRVSLPSFVQDIKTGYRLRESADPSFLSKSVTEILVAAGTQFAAEIERRGMNRVIPEADFIVAGILTAVYGKYSSMWKVARTTSSPGNQDIGYSEPKCFGLTVPTNCFQKFTLDGISVPTSKQRVGSLIAPMLPLFKAGMYASLVGYGFTACMIKLRSFLFPDYISATQSVNILYACLYTGAFMAFVSNIRYQLLQGLIEPVVDSRLQRVPKIRAIVIFVIRVMNGLLGSMLAISGMKLLGLQRLK